MRLTQIKLSGFKSFVDPTVIPVPGQLVAVVGPNGCGKSNLIDAVRWVLGEASAKQLRAEAMQDVIFNGSTQRKPVSRASVELIFDTKDSQWLGPYRAYSEVSIKRVLTRQGESSYFINGQPVRRRDIADIFLGTGVGVRGYAVIEQGMITRLIEARPDDLRGYLEEAAGISRYRERRRETERRLDDANENLKRVEDVCHELNRQREKLTAQADTAKRYYQLTVELKQNQACLAITRLRIAQREEADVRAKLAEVDAEELRLESLASELSSEHARAKHKQTEANNAAQHIQRQVYEFSTRLARLEEQQRYFEQQQQRITREQRVVSADYQAAEQAKQTSITESSALQDCINKLKHAYDEALAVAEKEADQLGKDLDTYQELNRVLLPQASRLEQLTRKRDLAKQRIEYLSQSLQRLSYQSHKLYDEKDKLFAAGDEGLTDTQDELRKVALLKEERSAALARDELRTSKALQALRLLEARLSTLRVEEARLDADILTRTALLNSVSQGDQLSEWVVAQQLESVAMLWQCLLVDTPWQRAVEAVLLHRLTARVAALPSVPPPAIYTLVDALATGQNGLLERNALAPSLEESVTSLPTLRGKVSVTTPFSRVLDDWLLHVFIVDSLEEAFAKRALLPSGGEWVTPEGHRVGKTHVTYFSPNAGEGLLFQRQQLDAAKVRRAELNLALDDVQRAHRRAAHKVAVLTAKVQAHKEDESRLASHYNQIRLELTRQMQLDRQRTERLAVLETEISLLEEEVHVLRTESEELNLSVEVAQIELDSLAECIQKLTADSEKAEELVSQQRHILRESEQYAHQLQLELASKQQRYDNEISNANGLERRARRLVDRLAELEQEALALEQTPERDRSEVLGLREESELRLLAKQQEQHDLAEALRVLTQRQQDIHSSMAVLREERTRWMLKLREAELAIARFSEELAEWQQAGELSAAPTLDNKDIGALSAQINRISRAIEALGPVNLAALEELAQVTERSDYLALQAEDLTVAATMLKEAIQKIDGDSRQQLTQTYTQVNASLSEIFPSLFGGGKARLTLSGEDILEAGVQIVAQPPGKKNSSIHLLSGGEKALTALSLVFALFSLNPAPFCLLDEVDAPLDEANTRRFCELVKKMAQSTQFLYISHNRLTMEIAEQLVGVTMQEQGVSRIVAVDVGETLALHSRPA